MRVLGCTPHNRLRRKWSTPFATPTFAKAQRRATPVRFTLRLAGIAERSRRPQRSPERTATAMEAQVVEWQRYPDWGA